MGGDERNYTVKSKEERMDGKERGGKKLEVKKDGRKMRDCGKKRKLRRVKKERNVEKGSKEK